MQTYHFAHRFSRRLALASALAVVVMGSVGTPGLAKADTANAHAAVRTTAAHSNSAAAHSGSHVALAHSAAAHSRSASHPTPAWQTGFFPRNTSALLASSRAFALLNTCTSHCGQASLQAAALLAALPDFSLEDGTVRTRALRTLDSRFSQIISTDGSSTAEIASTDNLEGSQQASPAQTSSSAELSTRLPRHLAGAFAASYDRLAMAQKYLIIRYSHVELKQDMLLNVQASEMFAAPFAQANEADPREKAYNWTPLASNPATLVDKATGLPAPTLAVLYMDTALEQAHALEETPQITSLSNSDRVLLLSSVARLALRAYQLGYPLILTAN